MKVVSGVYVLPLKRQPALVRRLMNNKEYEQQTFESYMGGYLDKPLPLAVKHGSGRDINPTVKEAQAIEDACQNRPPGVSRETLFHLIMEQTGEESNEELLELEESIHSDLDYNGPKLLGLYGNKYKKQKYNLWRDRLKLREL